tara:strand:+ start:964 stop:1671 length:708 start_codon:yes stop_codon:yes gene_type:complete
VNPPEGFQNWDEYDAHRKATGPSMRPAYPGLLTEFVATNPVTKFLVPGAEQFLQQGGRPSMWDVGLSAADLATPLIPLAGMVKKGSNIVNFPEQKWVSNHPTKDVPELLEERVRVQEFDRSMPDEIARDFDAVRGFPYYTETAQDAVAEKIRFSKYLDLVRDQMVKDGVVDAEDQAKKAYGLYKQKRTDLDMVWAAEQSSLGNKLGVSLDDWRDLTFLKGDDEVDAIIAGLRKKK